MIIASSDMVDSVGTGTTAQVADAAVVPEDAGALCVPLLRQASPTGAAFPVA